MKRVLASEPAGRIFHTGFKACNDYSGGEAAMERAACEVLFILGRNDQMTTPRAAQSIVSKAKRGKVVTLEAGHSLMLEAPEGVLFAMKDFLRP